MSGRSKVVSDKTEFLNFQPDKCPMFGAISRLAFKCGPSFYQHVSCDSTNMSVVIQHVYTHLNMVCCAQ